MVVLVIGLLVAGCLAMVAGTLVPAVQKGMDIRSADGRIATVSYQWYNGRGVFYITLAPGVPDTDGADVACNVVRPQLRGSSFENTDFVIYDSRGLTIASDQTACGG